MERGGQVRETEAGWRGGGWGEPMPSPLPLLLPPGLVLQDSTGQEEGKTHQGPGCWGSQAGEGEEKEVMVEAGCSSWAGDWGAPCR